MDDEEIKLRPHAPTFGGLEMSNSSSNSTQPHRELSPKSEPIGSVDRVKVLSDLLKNRMKLNELNGCQSMSLLCGFIKDVLKLSEHAAVDTNAIFKHTWPIILGSSMQEQNTEENANVEGKGYTEDSMLFGGSPEVYRELLEKVYQDKAKWMEEKRRADMVSASQEELGVPLRMTSRILSNFDEGLWGDSMNTTISTRNNSQDNINTSDNSNSSSLDKQDDQGQYNTPLLPITADDVEHYVKVNVGKYEQNIDSQRWLLLSRKFYLKSAPSVDIDSYMERINKFGGISGAVGLCAGLFLIRFLFNIKGRGLDENGIVGDMRLWPLPLSEDLCNMEPDNKFMNVSSLNVFRLVLTSIRLSLKLVEDKNFQQGYFCRICGLQKTEDLFRMELAMGFGIDWSVFMNNFELWRVIVIMEAVRRHVTDLQL